MNLNPISFEKTNKALSANAGLVFLEQLVGQLGLESKLSKLLPVKKKGRRAPKDASLSCDGLSRVKFEVIGR